MKLVRRRRAPNPAQRAYKIFRLALRGLVAQRVARRAFKTYRFARRLPLLIGGGAIAFLLLRKLRGGNSQATPSEPWTAPPVTPPAPIQTAGSGTPAPTTAAETAGAEAAGTAEPVTPATTTVEPAEPEAIGADAKGGPDLPSEGDGAPDPDLSASAAATDAGTTGGGSKAIDDDA